MKNWQEIASALQKYRDDYREFWGEIDDLAITKYISGVCEVEEEQAVEQAMRSKPAVRDLVEAVRDALRPVWVAPEEAAAVNEVERPEVRSVLRESLRAWLDEEGRLLASGCALLVSGLTGRAFGMAMNVHGVPAAGGLPSADSLREQCTWQIPVDERGYHLTVTARPAADAGLWEVTCAIASETDRQIVERARFSLAQPGELPVVEASFGRYAGKSIEITTGTWEFSVMVADDVRVVRLEVGTTDSVS